MSKINIPPEAVEAAVRTHMNLKLATRERAMDAAIRAALENWTGVLSANKHNGIFVGCSALILPLTENPDAEA